MLSLWLSRPTRAFTTWSLLTTVPLTAPSELLDQLGGDVTIIRNPTNEGFGPACNKGAAAATNEFVLFLNNDTVLLPGWLDPLLEAMDGDQRLAAVQPRLIYPDGRLNSAGDLVFADQAWNYGKGHPRPCCTAICRTARPGLRQWRLPNGAQRNVRRRRGL